jgi:hypothetical protein
MSHCLVCYSCVIHSHTGHGKPCQMQANPNDNLKDSKLGIIHVRKHKAIKSSTAHHTSREFLLEEAGIKL